MFSRGHQVMLRLMGMIWYYTHVPVLFVVCPCTGGHSYLKENRNFNYSNRNFNHSNTFC